MGQWVGRSCCSQEADGVTFHVPLEDPRAGNSPELDPLDNLSSVEPLVGHGGRLAVDTVLQDAARTRKRGREVAEILLLCGDLVDATTRRLSSLTSWVLQGPNLFALVDIMLAPAFMGCTPHTSMDIHRRHSLAVCKLLSSPLGRDALSSAGLSAVARSVMRVVAAPVPADEATCGCAITILGEVARHPDGGSSAISALVDGNAGVELLQAWVGHIASATIIDALVAASTVCEEDLALWTTAGLVRLLVAACMTFDPATPAKAELADNAANALCDIIAWLRMKGPGSSSTCQSFIEALCDSQVWVLLRPSDAARVGRMSERTAFCGVPVLTELLHWWIALKGITESSTAPPVAMVVKEGLQTIIAASGELLPPLVAALLLPVQRLAHRERLFLLEFIHEAVRCANPALDAALMDSSGPSVVLNLAMSRSASCILRNAATQVLLALLQRRDDGVEALWGCLARVIELRDSNVWHITVRPIFSELVSRPTPLAVQLAQHLIMATTLCPGLQVAQQQEPRWLEFEATIVRPGIEVELGTRHTSQVVRESVGPSRPMDGTIGDDLQWS